MKSKTTPRHISPADERAGAAPSPAADWRNWRSQADYLRQAHEEFSSAVETAGFELREVTLFFYEDEEGDEVRVKAELRVAAELLDLSAAADSPIGDPRPSQERVLSESED